MQLIHLNTFVVVSIGVFFSPADQESAGKLWQLHPNAGKSATNCADRCFENTPLSRQQRIPRSSHQQHGLASDHSTNSFDGTLLSKEKANTPQSQGNFPPQIPKIPKRIAPPYHSAGRLSSGPVEEFSKGDANSSSQKAGHVSFGIGSSPTHIKEVSGSRNQRLKQTSDRHQQPTLNINELAQRQSKTIAFHRPELSSGHTTAKRRAVNSVSTSSSPFTTKYVTVPPMKIVRYKSYFRFILKSACRNAMNHSLQIEAMHENATGTASQRPKTLQGCTDYFWNNIFVAGRIYQAIDKVGHGATLQNKLPRNNLYFLVSNSSDSKMTYHNSNRSELQNQKRNLQYQYVIVSPETVVDNDLCKYISVQASSMLSTLFHPSGSYTGTDADYSQIYCWFKKSLAYRCHCDDLCPIFADCCADYYQLCLGQNITQEKTRKETVTIPGVSRKIPNFPSRLGCVKLVTNVTNFYFRAVNSCDDKVRDRQAMNKKLCEDVTVHPNITSIPFPLLSNRAIIFKNVYCAFCNGIHQSELDVSKAVIFYECDHMEETSDFTRRVSQAVETGKCKRTLDSNIVSLLRACPLRDLPPPMILNLARQTTPIFSGGLSQTRIPGVESACLFMVPSSATTDTMYSLTGSLPSGMPDTSPKYGLGSPNVFRVYFQLTDTSWGYRVRQRVISPPLVGTCPDDKVYIPYYNDCEPLSCEPHAYPFRGRCLIKDRLIAESSLQPLPNGTRCYSLSLRLQSRQHLQSVGLPTMAEAAVDVNHTFTSVLRKQSTNVEGSTFAVSGMDNAEDRIRMSVRMNITVNNASLQDVLIMSKTLENFTDMSKSSSLFELHSIVVSNMLNIPEDWKCPNGTLKAHSNLTLVTDDTKRYFARNWTTYYELENVGFELQTLPEKNFTPVLLNSLVCESSTLIYCDGKGYVHLNVTMFIISNDTLTVKQDGNVFNKSEFVVFDNGSAIVCSIYNSTYVHKVYRYIWMKDYLLERSLTIAALTSSIVCLFIMLITYSLLPQLRNVPGVIIMSYSGSLMGSQLLTLTAALPRGWLCVLHACLSHGMMLSSFLWKSMLSFDLVFMMGLNSVKNSSHAKRALMLNCYSVVSWVLPVVFVLLFWLLDFFQVYVIQYGSRLQGACWVARPLANLYLVMIPLGLTWLFNSVCLSLALCRIRLSGRLTQTAVRSKNQGLTTRHRVMVSFRIGLLLDCTWVLCFVAAALDVDRLWLAHTILNGAQGVYLLLCFVAKRRVWGMMRDRLGVKQKEPTSHNANSNRDNNIGKSIAKSTISAHTSQSVSLHSTLECY